MKKTKTTVEGVSVIITEKDELGNDIIQLCGKLADEADRERIELYRRYL